MRKLFRWVGVVVAVVVVSGAGVQKASASVYVGNPIQLTYTGVTTGLVQTILNTLPIWAHVVTNGFAAGTNITLTTNTSGVITWTSTGTGSGGGGTATNALTKEESTNLVNAVAATLTTPAAVTNIVTNSTASIIDRATNWLSFVFFPDAQSIIGSSYQYLSNSAKWVASNAGPLGIKFCLFGGDLADSNYIYSVPRFDYAGMQLESITNGSVPYVMTTGNHDRDDTNVGVLGYNTNFNGRFTVGMATNYSWFHGGGWYTETNREDFYFLATNGTYPYGVMSIAGGPVLAEMLWATNVLAQYPNHTWFIVTHAFLNGDGWPILTTSGQSMKYFDGRSLDGSEMWTNYFSYFSNIAFIANGHVTKSGDAYNTLIGRSGNKVYCALQNNQGESEYWEAYSYELGVYRYNFQTKSLERKTFSPFWDQRYPATHMSWLRSQRNQWRIDQNTAPAAEIDELRWADGYSGAAGEQKLWTVGRSRGDGQEFWIRRGTFNTYTNTVLLKLDNVGNLSIRGVLSNTVTSKQFELSSNTPNSIVTATYGSNLVTWLAGSGSGGGGITASNSVVCETNTTVSTNILALDARTNNYFVITLGANAYLDAPTNAACNRQKINIELVQDATGNRTITNATRYLFGNMVTGPNFTLTTNANARDIFNCVYLQESNAWSVVGYSGGF